MKIPGGHFAVSAVALLTWDHGQMKAIEFLTVHHLILLTTNPAKIYSGNSPG